MRRPATLAALALSVVLGACAGAVGESADLASADSPAIQAAAVEPAMPAGGMSGDELEALTDAADSGVDGGERDTSDATSAVEFGHGLDSAEIETLLTPLAEAEAWLAELEVQWDNGMTYSEIFRAWRSVSAETGPALAAFELPDAADETQHHDLSAYLASVQGAHDEWQSTVDFIVTYITNYTPEILITKAYQEVEVHLRNAAELRQGLGVPEAARPEIVIEELVDL